MEGLYFFTLLLSALYAIGCIILNEAYDGFTTFVLKFIPIVILILCVVCITNLTKVFEVANV